MALPSSDLALAHGLLNLCWKSTAQRTSVAAKYGGFEAHTTGFGSRMMARWGFGGAGAGLGARQQGIAEPIAAVRRAKGLGLGAGD